jgi:hypothetical protein
MQEIAKLGAPLADMAVSHGGFYVFVPHKSFHCANALREDWDMIRGFIAKH